jgi:hypothetical protein
MAGVAIMVIGAALAYCIARLIMCDIDYRWRVRKAVDSSKYPMPISAGKESKWSGRETAQTVGWGLFLADITLLIIAICRACCVER